MSSMRTYVSDIVKPAGPVVRSCLTTLTGHVEMAAEQHVMHSLPSTLSTKGGSGAQPARVRSRPVSPAAVAPPAYAPTVPADGPTGRRADGPDGPGTLVEDCGSEFETASRCRYAVDEGRSATSVFVLARSKPR